MLQPNVSIPGRGIADEVGGVWVLRDDEWVVQETQAGEWRRVGQEEMLSRSGRYDGGVLWDN